MSQALLTGLLGIAAIVVCWALAVVLYRVGTAGSQARKLALLLLVEGVMLATAGYVEMVLGIPEDFFETYPLFGQIVFGLHTIVDAALLALYPPFLAAALQTKMTRPFANKQVCIGLWVAAVVLVVAVNVTSLEIGATMLYLLLSLLFGFALVASINAWYTATGANRDRAGAFAIAFGIRDVCWGFVYAASIWEIWTGTYITQGYDVDYLSIVYALGTLLAVPLIAYGILRAHLFNIDLRIQWTIKQSTLATVVVMIIFLGSEGIDRFLSAEFGDYTGLMAAAIVLFFLAPLQRFAESVASAAMPNTRNTPGYAAHRKMQIYEAALAEAQQEDGISDKERSLLNRLRDSLDISPTDADALESELQSGSGG
jgi:hypothetical protein